MKLPPVTDLTSLPLLLTLSEIAAIYRVSIPTIRRGLKNGTFSPRPFEDYPYRWRREDVEADLKRPRQERPHKLHGFAVTRARPKKATLDERPASTRSAS